MSTKKKISVDSTEFDLGSKSSFFSPQKAASEPEKVQAPELEPSNASMIASKHDSTTASPASTIEAVRKVVKSVGNTPLFVRVTEAEKDELFDITTAYKKKKIKTSENEIARIALNYMINDYKENKQGSALAKVLNALYE